MNKNGLHFTVKKLLQENGTLNPGTGVRLDEKGSLRKWTQGFFNRYPKLTIRISEYLHGGRASASESSIRKWFKEVCFY